VRESCGGDPGAPRGERELIRADPGSAGSAGSAAGSTGESEGGDPEPEQDTVVLMTFSRSPECLRQALHTCLDLGDCRMLLHQAGKAAELPSGAKIFVPPDRYDATLDALRDRDLKAWHVVAATEYEQLVKDVVHSLPKKFKVYFRTAESLSLGSDEHLPYVPPRDVDGRSLPVVPTDDDFTIIVSRTFITIDVPSSLWSKSFGRHTNSTRGVDGRGGKNPRCVKRV